MAKQMTYGEIISKFSTAIQHQDWEGAAKLLRTLDKPVQTVFLNNTTVGARNKIAALLK